MENMCPDQFFGRFPPRAIPARSSRIKNHIDDDFRVHPVEIGVQ